MASRFEPAATVGGNHPLVTGSNSAVPSPLSRRWMTRPRLAIVESAGSPRHADARRNFPVLVLEEIRGGVLEPIPIRILQLVHVAVVAEGKSRPSGA